MYCPVTGFGQTGPYRTRAGFDIVAQGLSGLTLMTDYPGDRPVKVGFAVHDVAAAMSALSSILAAFVHRLRTGDGQYMTYPCSNPDWRPCAGGCGVLRHGPPAGGHRDPASTARPYQALRTGDGCVTVGANNDKLWRSSCIHVIECPEMLKDSRYASISARGEHGGRA